jgi:hypothetical protein
MAGFFREVGDIHSELIMVCRYCIAAMMLGLLASTGAAATDVTVAGLFPNKALVQIDGGALRTLSVGQKTAEGVLLLSVEADSATFEIQGMLNGVDAVVMEGGGLTQSLLGMSFLNRMDMKREGDIMTLTKRY